jgi:hypothetical protein
LSEDAGTATQNLRSLHNNQEPRDSRPHLQGAKGGYQHLNERCHHISNKLKNTSHSNRKRTEIHSPKCKEQSFSGKNYLARMTSPTDEFCDCIIYSDDSLATVTPAVLQKIVQVVPGGENAH